MHLRLIAVLLILTASLGGFVVPAWAQRTTATFAGLVVDTSSGILPGADVELTNEETGVIDRQVTSATGDFIFNYVPRGTYALTVSLTGFKTVTVKGISLGAAQDVRRTFQLEIGQVNENITVSGAAPLINTASAEQRVGLETRSVETLPTANRNITNILNIAAGVTTQEAESSSAPAAAARRLRLNGLGGNATSVTANGTDASGNAGARQLSQYNGISKIDVVSMEAVSEVNIVKGVVPAEYGMAMGGNLNVITKAGTNVWHGSAFHRYEGSALVAKPVLLRDKPDSRWNQYGGSFGGRIVKDRAFFFGAFEGYRQKDSLPLNVNVPTQRFRDLALTALPYPETLLALQQYPYPNQPGSPDALTGVFIGAGARMNNDEHVDLRTDVRVAGGNLSATFTGGHPSLSQAQVFPGELRVWQSLTRRASSSYALARGRWSSETRFGYSYNYMTRTDPYFHVVDPSVTTVGRDAHRGVSRLAFPGITNNTGGEQHVRGTVPSYSFEQQVTKVMDRHAIKFGGIYALSRGGRWNYSASTLTFSTLADLLANRPQVAVSFTSPQSVWATTNFGFFAQDDWRLNRKLTVNLGLRYDYFGRYRITGVNEPAGYVNLDGQPNENFTFGPQRPLDRIYDDDAGLNLGPRIGFAYDVDGQGKTIVNGGWGMMFQPYENQPFEQSISNVAIPRNLTYTVQEAAAAGLKWPFYSNDLADVLKSRNLPPIVGELINPQLQGPYAMVFTVALARALTNSLVVEGAYVGTRGYKFSMRRTYNVPDAVTGIRPNPSLSQARYHDNAQQTTYHAFQTFLRERLSHNVTFNLNYTLSKNMATAGGDASFTGSLGDDIDTVQDFFDLESAWGPAQGDIKHLFIGSVIYEVPSSGFSSALARHLIGGWQLSGIFRLSTGFPLTVTQTSQRPGGRPDVLDPANAVNTDCCSLDNRQYLNRDAFALIPLSSVSRQTIRAGNVGHGQFRGPNYRNLDFSLAKSIPVGRQRKVELRVDMLNALNLTNFIGIRTTIESSDFGTAISTSPARQIQVQARFSF